MESIFDPYEEVLREAWGDEEAEEFLEEFEDGCEGCGGCCMNISFETFTMSNYTRGICENMEMEEDGVVKYFCEDYSERPSICQDYEIEKTEDGLECHPFLAGADDEEAVEILDVLYRREGLDMKERIKSAREVQGL